MMMAEGQAMMTGFIHRRHGTFKGGSVMNKWRCTICGYAYDPYEGDVGNGVSPGTPFEELPAGWECPRCGVGKDLFEEIR